MTGTGGSDRTAALNAPVPRGEPPEVRIRASFLSDPGLVRKNNEDACLVADLAPGGGPLPDGVDAAVGPKGFLLAVSDGMGGQEAGEVASALAVQTMLEVLHGEWTARQERDDPAELRNDLRTAVDRANRAVLDHVAENPALEGMGATLTATAVFGPLLLVAHVGDSRCYLLRGGLLKALTSDQSLAEELVRRGIVERGSEAYAARRSVLTRVVGQRGRLDPDSDVVQLARGDRLLLCSDGLTGPVSEETIRDLLAAAADPRAAVRALVEEARRCGAPDNVTCVAAWLSGTGLPDPSSIDAGGDTESVRLDAELMAAAGDATLALSEAGRDLTGDFPAAQVEDDDTLAGTLGSVAAASTGEDPGGGTGESGAASETPAPSDPGTVLPASPPAPAPAPAPAAPRRSPDPVPSPREVEAERAGSGLRLALIGLAVAAIVTVLFLAFF